MENNFILFAEELNRDQALELRIDLIDHLESIDHILAKLLNPFDNGRATRLYLYGRRTGVLLSPIYCFGGIYGIELDGTNYEVDGEINRESLLGVSPLLKVGDLRHLPPPDSYSGEY